MRNTRNSEKTKESETTMEENENQKVEINSVEKDCPLESSCLLDALGDSQLETVYIEPETEKENEMSQVVCNKCESKETVIMILSAKYDEVHKELKSVKVEKKKEQKKSEKEKDKLLEEIETLKAKLKEKENETIVLEERIIIKDEEIKMDRKNKPEINKKQKKGHTLGEIENGLEPVSDTEEDEPENIESHRKGTIQCIKNGLELCKNKRECAKETIEVGIECKKLHIEEK